MPNIVVIEQDLSMRVLFCEWLAGDGHAVRGCVQDRVAADEQVDLVVVDLLDLHDQSLRTVQQVREHFPSAALIGTSTRLCHALAAGSPQALRYGVSRLVPKPCSRSELLNAVADTLAGGH